MSKPKVNTKKTVLISLAVMTIVALAVIGGMYKMNKANSVKMGQIVANISPSLISNQTPESNVGSGSSELNTEKYINKEYAYMLNYSKQIAVEVLSINPYQRLSINNATAQIYAAHNNTLSTLKNEINVPWENLENMKLLKKGENFKYIIGDPKDKFSITYTLTSISPLQFGGANWYTFESINNFENHFPITFSFTARNNITYVLIVGKYPHDPNEKAMKDALESFEFIQ